MNSRVSPVRICWNTSPQMLVLSIGRICRPWSALSVIVCATAIVLLSSCASTREIPFAKNSNASEPKQRLSARVVPLPNPVADSLQFQPGKARDYYIKGSLLQMQERHAEAILEFLQSLRYDNAPAIHYAIGLNYSKLGKQDLALESLRTAITRDSTLLPAYKLLGDIYVQQFRVDEAITLYQYLSQQESDPMNLFMLARLYELRNADKAIELYNEILRTTDENDGMILARLAELYSQKGNSAKALECLEKLRSSAPDNQAVLYTLMEAYLFQKNFPQGFELFTSSENILSEQDAMRLAVQYANALLQNMEQMNTARVYAEKFLDRVELRNKNSYATSWQIQLMCGMLAGNLERTAKSSLYFEQALTLADSVVEVPLQICAFQFQKRRYTDMTRTAERASRLFPSNGQVYFLWGLGLSQMDSTKRAIGVLQKAVEVDTSNIDAWNQLGILNNSLGNLPASDAAYERVLTLDPANALANNNYAYSLSERNTQLERAQGMVESALKAEPKNPSYLDTMGWILFQRGNFNKAVEFIQKAIDNGEGSATIYEHLGDAYDQLGNREKALEAWREALIKEPYRHSVKERLSNGTSKKK
jgi:tetratricopeptide (TPR) repeat protein